MKKLILSALIIASALFGAAQTKAQPMREVVRKVDGSVVVVKTVE